MICTCSGAGTCDACFMEMTDPQRDPLSEPVSLPSEQPEDGLEKFYDTGYVADLFSVVPETIADWIKAGEIRAIKITGGRWRIPKSAIIEYANKRYAKE